MVCLRGLESQTFGSGVPCSPPLNIWGKPDFQGETSCFPLRTFSQNQAGLRTFCDMLMTWQRKNVRGISNLPHASLEYQ